MTTHRLLYDVLETACGISNEEIHFRLGKGCISENPTCRACRKGRHRRRLAAWLSMVRWRLRAAWRVLRTGRYQ